MKTGIVCLCVILALTTGSIISTIGCMEKGRHGKTHDGYDYKTLHYVACSCPCKKYRHMARKNKCAKCGHYTDSRVQDFDTSFLYLDQPPTLFNKVKPFTYF